MRNTDKVLPLAEATSPKSSKARKVRLADLGETPEWLNNRLHCGTVKAVLIARFCYKYRVPVTAMERLLRAVNNTED